MGAWTDHKSIVYYAVKPYKTEASNGIFTQKFVQTSEWKFEFLHWCLVSVNFWTGKNGKDGQNGEYAKVTLWFIHWVIDLKMNNFSR